MIVIPQKTKEPKPSPRILTVRMRKELVNQLDELAKATKRSRNEVIQILLNEMVDRVEIAGPEQENS